MIYKIMNRTILTILTILLLIIGCKKENKSTNMEVEKVEKRSNISSYNKEIISFLKETETITNYSYTILYDLIVKDYILDRNNDKYRVIIHIAKKTLKEKDIYLKNEMYKNLKSEILKNNNFK